MNILIQDVILNYLNIHLCSKYLLRSHHGPCLSCCSVSNFDFPNILIYQTLTFQI